MVAEAWPKIPGKKILVIRTRCRGRGAVGAEAMGCGEGVPSLLDEGSGGGGRSGEEQCPSPKIFRFCI